MKKFLIFLLFISYISSQKRFDCNCPPGQRCIGGKCFPSNLRKPVIYLYPEESMDVSVQLNLKESNLPQFILNLMEKILGMFMLNQMEIS